MKHFVPARIRIEKNVITRVIRVLKGKGQFSVSAGQEVTPPEIIGSSIISAGFRCLNLSDLLSADPATCSKYLTKKLGQRIYKGELLAYKKGGLFGGKKLITSPADGVLDFLNSKTGELKILFLPKKIDLPAGVYGVVESVDKERGLVVIRTLVNRIYGILGSGKCRDGILRFLGKRDELVTKDVIESKYGGQILVGGSLFFKEAISAAIAAGVSGIIAGGINAKDYQGMAGGRLIFTRQKDTDIGISAVVTEGYGLIPIGLDIYEELLQYEGKFVFINGNEAVIDLPVASSVILIKIRNTRLSELEGSRLVTNAEHVRLDTELKIGSKVRVVGNSYGGEVGKVIAVDNALTLLTSGIRAYMVGIETASRKIQVPVANLEIID